MKDAMIAELQRYILQVTPQSHHIREQFELYKDKLHPSQRDIVRLRCLHLHSLLERVYMIISTSTLVPLANPDSIINNIRSILEFCRRPESHYSVLINDFEFAIRGVVNLLNISNLSSLAGEPLVSSDVIRRINELKAYIIESNKRDWQMYMEEGTFEWITSNSLNNTIS